ncbi:MAG: FtsX-like permease family protein, partial [Spirochaetes bacterium]|nr:FtsX-like permease family protein [Spirochaetota bacterium]
FLGTLISIMIISGSIMIGDSVKYSLEKMVYDQLGKSRYLVHLNNGLLSKEFISNLQNQQIADCFPIFILTGSGINQNQNIHLQNLQIIGIDDNFFQLRLNDYKNIALQNNEVFINQKTAAKLGVASGDELLLVLKAPQGFSLELPFQNTQNDQYALNVKVKGILDEKNLGNFSLKSSQIEPVNLFIGKKYLLEQLNLSSAGSHLIIAQTDTEESGRTQIKTEKAREKEKSRGNREIIFSRLERSINQSIELKDFGFKIRSLKSIPGTEIITDAVFFSVLQEEEISDILADAKPVISYFVNEITHQQKSTPYSFISASESFLIDNQMNEQEIIISQWLADDLEAQINDSLKIRYFILEKNQLVEKEINLQVSGILNFSEQGIDSQLMPGFPGFDGKPSCSHWDPGIPIDLKKIRPKDEEFWQHQGGTPKAIISYQLAERIFSNRFGSATAMRTTQNWSAKELIKKLLESEYFKKQIRITSIKDQLLRTSNPTVDFGQLFLGLSFFILVAGFILVILLFYLKMDYYQKQLGTLSTLGYNRWQIGKIILLEIACIILIASLAGVICGMIFTKLILMLLKSTWIDVIGTSYLFFNFNILSVLISLIVSWVILISLILFLIYKILKKPLFQLQQGFLRAKKVKNKNYSWLYALISWSLVVFLLFLSFFYIKNQNTMLFFGAGWLLLIGGIFYSDWFFFYFTHQIKYKRVSRLSLVTKNIYKHRIRSLAIIAILAFSIFTVIAVGINKKEHKKEQQNYHSGTGGYQYILETTQPVLLAEIPVNHQDFQINPIRIKKGDNASCLNLNQVENFQLMGIQKESFKPQQRFSFAKVQRSGLYPWQAIQKESENQIIPAIADQTVITWSFGKKVGDYLEMVDEHGQFIKLKLIAALNNSIFQGNILISEENLLKHFPSQASYQWLLVEISHNKPDQILEQLKRTFRVKGLTIYSTTAYLNNFLRVENTYLTIFLALGSLGILLGIFGLAVVVIRNIEERKTEIALYYTLGYSRQKIIQNFWLENILLFCSGFLIGLFSAVIAVIPTLVQQFDQIPWLMLLLLILSFIFTGILLIRLMITKFLKPNYYLFLRQEYKNINLVNLRKIKSVVICDFS